MNDYSQLLTDGSALDIIQWINASLQTIGRYSMDVNPLVLLSGFMLIKKLLEKKTSTKIF